MAEAVVDALQAVEIDEDDRAGRLSAPRAHHLRLGKQEEAATVQQAGQRIGDRETADLLVMAHALRRVVGKAANESFASRVVEREARDLPAAHEAVMRRRVLDRVDRLMAAEHLEIPRAQPRGHVVREQLEIGLADRLALVEAEVIEPVAVRVDQRAAFVLEPGDEIAAVHEGAQQHAVAPAVVGLGAGHRAQFLDLESQLGDLGVLFVDQTLHVVGSHCSPWVGWLATGLHANAGRSSRAVARARASSDSRVRHGPRAVTCKTRSGSHAPEIRRSN